jgi:hypothetical protein
VNTRQLFRECRACQSHGELIVSLPYTDDSQLADLLAARPIGIVLLLLPVARFRRTISTVA